MQVVKLGMDARDQRLSEFRKKVLEILYDPQCHLNHDVRDHVGWCVFAALYFAPIANALLVFVDLRALDLLNANDHFVILADVFQQCQNGHGMLKTQGLILTRLRGCRCRCRCRLGDCIKPIKFSLDGKKVLAEQRGAAGNNE